jgi:hypothetical protein
MYAHLQDEIRQDLVDQSNLDPQASSFEALLGARSKSPNKNYDFAEK